MKPKDLKYPFIGKEKTVLLEEGILYSPEGFEKDKYPESLFPNSNPIALEYCSGNGAWIAAKALANPGINWIAVEKKFDRCRKIWSKGQNFSLKNLLVVVGEGMNFTQKGLLDSSIQEIFINFPDPWPKKRHWKHRIIQQPFLLELDRILKPDGKMTFVTDDENYSTVFIEEMRLSQKFHSVYPSPYYIEEMPLYGSSYFDELWRSKGKTIRYHSYQK